MNPALMLDRRELADSRFRLAQLHAKLLAHFIENHGRRLAELQQRFIASLMAKKGSVTRQ
jgi:hypothetical protein